MMILGVDPSLSATGIALVGMNERGKSEICIAKTMPDHSKLDLLPRIFEISNEVRMIIQTAGPKVGFAVAIEHNVQVVYRDNRGVKRNKSPKSLLGQANLIGAIADAAMAMIGPEHVHLVNPSSAKLALTGHGAANKHTMIRYAATRTSWAPPKTERAQEAEADAIGVAFAGFRPYRQMTAAL